MTKRTCGIRSSGFLIRRKSNWPPHRRGEEGLKVIPKFKPDLVLMDVRMGGMNGLETLRRIRAANPKLLVILMTAYGTTQTAIEAMKLGAYDYLLKPFDVPKLKEIVANALKAARDMKQVVSYRAAARIRGLRTGHRRPQRTDAAGLQAHRPGRRQRRHRAHHRRERHRQGTRRPRDLSSQQPQPAAVSGRQLRRDPRATARKRTVRPRTRRVHRRDHAAHRQIRAMQPRHDFSGRNRRHDARHADENPARAANRHVRARRRQPADPGGRARHRRHEQAARSRRGRANSSARTCFTGSTSCAFTFRRCATGARTFRCW